MFLDIIHIVLTKLYVNEYNRKHTYTSYFYHPLSNGGHSINYIWGHLSKRIVKWGEEYITLCS